MNNVERIEHLRENLAAMESLLALLTESKSIVTHGVLRDPKRAAKNKRARAHAKLVKQDLRGWERNMERDLKAATRKYNKVKATFKRDLRAAVFGYLNGKRTSAVMSKAGKKAFETAYRATYRLGLKASGMGEVDLPSVPRKIKVNKKHEKARRQYKREGPPPSKSEEAWIKSSLKDERKYWNKFLSDVRDRNFKRFTPSERIDMYVDSLDHVFNSAMVVSQPHNVIIRWKMNPRKEHCELCEYLEKNSPYTRENLPGVPRDGNTCFGLSNCGCELVFVASKTSHSWARARRKSRAKLLREMKRIRTNKRSSATSSSLSGRKRARATAPPKVTGRYSAKRKAAKATRRTKAASKRRSVVSRKRKS